MKLINPKSKRAFVNLFSDFVLQKLGKNTKTIIQTTLYDNFIVVNGKTESDNDINIGEIKTEFFELHNKFFKELDIKETIGTLNMISKTDNFFKNNCYRSYLDLYNTKRPLYHKNVLNYYQNSEWDAVGWRKELIVEVPHSSILPTCRFTFSPIDITSEFPYGYGLKIGRSLIYYAEYVALNIFGSISVENMKMMITNQKNTDGDQIIEIKSNSPYPSDKIKSMILDNFSFNLEQFEEKFLDYELSNEILNVEGDKPWLIRNIVSQDLIIF
jgi:hypothetical protein